MNLKILTFPINILWNCKTNPLNDWLIAIIHHLLILIINNFIYI